MTLYYIWRWAALILAGLLIYGQTFQYDFVFDDHVFIAANPYIQNLSHVHLMWQFTPMTRSVGYYSFALNYSLNQLHPMGYHIFNFIVHLTATGLVWALAGMLLEGDLPFIIAVLFLVHPCQTQAVSYITQRFESMATVFYLATMYCYLSARISKDKLRKIILFGLSGLLSILGILTKEVVITVPAMMLATEWILFPKKDDTKLYAIIAAGGVLLYFLFTQLVHTDLRIFLHSVPSLSHDGDVLTPMHYFLTQMRVFLTFLRLLILPIHQNVDYDYVASTGLLHPALTLAGLGTILFIIFLVFKLRRRFPLIAFGLAWVLITFSINLAPRENVIFEHKLYLISFGFFLAFVSSLQVSLRAKRSNLLTPVLWSIILILAVISFQRNKVWKNDLTLWNNTVEESPRKARPYNNRGFQYYRQGKLTEAMADFNKAIELNPHYAAAYNDLGALYGLKGDLALALTYANKAIEIDPGYADAYKNRAFTYYQLKEYDNAWGDVKSAEKLGTVIDPQLISALVSLRVKRSNL